MKILTISGKEFKLDDEDYESFKDKKIHISKSNQSRSGYARLSNGKLLHKLIKPEFKRVVPKDGDWTNLTKDNLIDGKRDLNKEVEWRKNHYEQIRERVRTWRSDNKEYEYEYEKKKRYKLKYKYINLKSTAKKRGLEMTITEEEYCQILSRGCFYTGEELVNIENFGYSLDRIDNLKGYTLDNVLPCIGWVNMMRQDQLTVEETKIAVDAILKYRKEETNG